MCTEQRGEAICSGTFLVKETGHALGKHRAEFIARLFGVRKIDQLRAIANTPGIEAGVDDQVHRNRLAKSHRLRRKPAAQIVMHGYVNHAHTYVFSSEDRGRLWEGGQPHIGSARSPVEAAHNRDYAVNVGAGDLNRFFGLRIGALVNYLCPIAEGF